MAIAPETHPTCTEIVVGRALRALRLTNDLLSMTILLDQGADIHSLVYRPRGIDLLWKSPLPIREPGIGPTPAGDSLVLWRTYYRGGWQMVFPNFGAATEHRGAPLDVHGEAARTVWQIEKIESSAAWLEVVLGVALLRSPFCVRRSLRLEMGQPVLAVRETVTNVGPEPMECAWGHHPAFGPPILSAASVIDTGAQSMVSDDEFDPPGNDLPPGISWAWPFAIAKDGRRIDLSSVPGPDTRLSRVVYLKDFQASWLAITNQPQRLGIGLAWTPDLLPFVALWQETGGTLGYPWYGKANLMAVEPISSYPGQGLTQIIRKTGTHLVLAPGESRTLDLTAVVYESDQRIARITPDGDVAYS